MSEDRDGSVGVDVGTRWLNVKLDGCGCLVLAVALWVTVAAFSMLWELFT